MAHYLQVIDERLPREGPTMFGLHPNAEIGFLTTEGDALFKVQNTTIYPLVTIADSARFGRSWRRRTLSHAP